MPHCTPSQVACPLAGGTGQGVQLAPPQAATLVLLRHSLLQS
jgi:hypothetical protein